MNPAEHAQRVFGPVDSPLGEDGRVQRRQPVLDLERVVPVALEGRLHQFRAQLRHDIRTNQQP